MRFQVITVLPQIIENGLRDGVVGQAFQRGLVSLQTVNPRAFTTDVHHAIDDRPFGGGDGMVMQYGFLKKSLDSLGASAGRRVLLSPQGTKWTDALARKWAASGENITLICGRYGGLDQRFINECVDEEISLGDYVLSGGELGALVVIDSIVRLLPEVLGNAHSAHAESFADGLLEAPLFTRPRDLGEQEVPEVFLSGDHKKIAEARRVLALLVTAKKRPDLLTGAHRDSLAMAKRNVTKLFSAAELEVCGLKREDWVQENE